MKHLYKLLFLTLLMPNIGLAQGNLIPNASFEDTVSCPYGAADINALSDWYNAGGSPDYFHPCANSTTPQNGVPQNIAGYQSSYLGEAYAGVITHASFSPSIREYIGVELQQPLVIGAEYFVSAFISKGDASSVAWNSDCASNKFGFKFSTAKYDAFVFTSAPPDNFAQVYSDEVITDSINWVQISGSFIADSAYSFLRIGNFYDISNTTITPCVGDAYYFIDNVCVSTSSTTCEVTTPTSNPLPKSEIQISPNPTADFIDINFPSLTGSYTVSVYDVSGRQILQVSDISKQGRRLDVSQAKPGLLLVRIEHNNQSYQYKIVKL